MAIDIEFRGSKRSFEYVGDLAAVRADPLEADRKEVKATLRDLRSSARKAAAKEVPDDARQLFESSGWVFAARKKAMDAAPALTREPPQTVVRAVLRNEHGQVFVESPRVVVRFSKEMDKQKVLEAMSQQQVRPVRSLGFAANMYQASGPAGAIEVSAKFSGEGLEFVEPELMQQLGGRLRPSDPQYSLQWQWNNDGSNGGIAGADVRAEDAWNLTLGAGVRIAVVDNGMDVTHPDLAPAIHGGGYFNEGLGSGPFVPFLPQDPDFPPGNHGTFCMGMAGARMNNGSRGVGGAPQSMLMPVACLGDQVGTQVTLARAIAYSANPQLEDSSASLDQGADVISCSLGPNGAFFQMESVLQMAIDFAVTEGRPRASGSPRGTAVFWAVSNGDVDIAHDEVCSYDNTIAVGRSTRLDLDDGSASGEELDFLAPGVEVFSTTQGGGFGNGTGTSYATPCAAAVAALALARFPDLSWTDLRERLRASCEKIGGHPYTGPDHGGRNDRYGFGRINALTAVS